MPTATQPITPEILSDACEVITLFEALEEVSHMLTESRTIKDPAHLASLLSVLAERGKALSSGVLDQLAQIERTA